MEIINCSNCNTQNPSSNKQCETCGVFLSIEEANNALQNSRGTKDKEITDLKKQMMAQQEQMKQIKESLMKDLTKSILDKINKSK